MITDKAGLTMLVESSRPPRPTFSTTASHFALPKLIYERRVVSSKNVAGTLCLELSSNTAEQGFQPPLPILASHSLVFFLGNSKYAAIQIVQCASHTDEEHQLSLDIHYPSFSSRNMNYTNFAKWVSKQFVQSLRLL